MSKFQMYKDAAGKYRFRLRAANGKIVAVGEAYEQRASCVNGIRSVQKNRKAPIEDLTINDRKVLNPKYQLYQDAAGEFRFRLKAPNGEIIAEGEGYETKESCLHGIEIVRGSGDAEIEDSTITKEAINEKTAETTEERASIKKAKMEEINTPKIETQMPPADLEAKTTTSVPKAELESLAGIEKSKRVEITIPKIEPAVPPLNLETKTEPASVMPEVKPEIPRYKPVLSKEMEIPQETFPIETKLDLYALPKNINKGNITSLKGKLYSRKTARGISGAKIKIYERDASILGDDYLAFGKTNEDGFFDINWKARPLSWRKTTGNIYAKFDGNEKAKPARSDTQTISIA